MHIAHGSNLAACFTLFSRVTAGLAGAGGFDLGLGDPFIDGVGGMADGEA
jgi:hypothetical protein